MLRTCFRLKGRQSSSGVSLEELSPRVLRNPQDEPSQKKILEGMRHVAASAGTSLDAQTCALPKSTRFRDTGAQVPRLPRDK